MESEDCLSMPESSSEELSSFGFECMTEANRDNIWCEQCKAYKQELQKLRADHTLNYNTLKKKIISTDLLIKKYKKKCEDHDILNRKFDETTKKLELVQRDSDMLQTQLTSSLQQVEPVKKAKSVLESELRQKCSEVQMLRDKLTASEASQKQFEQLNNFSHNYKEKFEDAKKEYSKKIKELESSLQKQETQICKLKEDCKTWKTENSKSQKQQNKLEEKLKKTTEKLGRYWDILKENGLLPKGEKREGHRNIINSADSLEQDLSKEGSNKTLGDDVDDVAEEEDMDDNDSIFSLPWISSPLVQILSPLPPSPVPNKRNIKNRKEGSLSDIDEDFDMSKVLEQEILKMSPLRRSPRILSPRLTTPGSRKSPTLKRKERINSAKTITVPVIHRNDRSRRTKSLDCNLVKEQISDLSSENFDKQNAKPGPIAHLFKRNKGYGNFFVKGSKSVSSCDSDEENSRNGVNVPKYSKDLIHTPAASTTLVPNDLQQRKMIPGAPDKSVPVDDEDQVIEPNLKKRNSLGFAVEPNMFKFADNIETGDGDETNDDDDSTNVEDLKWDSGLKEDSFVGGTISESSSKDDKTKMDTTLLCKDQTSNVSSHEALNSDALDHKNTRNKHNNENSKLSPLTNAAESSICSGSHNKSISSMQSENQTSFSGASSTCHTSMPVPQKLSKVNSGAGTENLHKEHTTTEDGDSEDDEPQMDRDLTENISKDATEQIQGKEDAQTKTKLKILEEHSEMKMMEKDVKQSDILGMCESESEKRNTEIGRGNVDKQSLCRSGKVFRENSDRSEACKNDSTSDPAHHNVVKSSDNTTCQENMDSSGDMKCVRRDSDNTTHKKPIKSGGKKREISGDTSQNNSKSYCDITSPERDVYIEGDKKTQKGDEAPCGDAVLSYCRHASDKTDESGSLSSQPNRDGDKCNNFTESQNMDDSADGKITRQGSTGFLIKSPMDNSSADQTGVSDPTNCDTPQNESSRTTTNKPDENKSKVRKCAIKAKSTITNKKPTICDIVQMTNFQEGPSTSHQKCSVPVYVPKSSHSAVKQRRSSFASAASSTVVSPEIEVLTSEDNARSSTPCATSSALGASTPVSPLPPSPFDFSLPFLLSPLPPSPLHDTDPLSPLPESPLVEDDIASRTLLNLNQETLSESEVSEDLSPVITPIPFLPLSATTSKIKTSSPLVPSGDGKRGLDTVPCSFHSKAPPGAIQVKPQNNCSIVKGSSNTAQVKKQTTCSSAKDVQPDHADPLKDGVKKRRKRRSEETTVKSATKEKKQCIDDRAATKKESKPVSEHQESGINVEMMRFIDSSHLKPPDVAERIVGSCMDSNTVHPLIQWIIQYLRSNTVEVFGMIHCYCAYSGTNQSRNEPFLTSGESRLLEFLHYVFQKDEWKSVKPKLLEALWNSIFLKDVINQLGRSALCRLYTAIGQFDGDIERVRVLFYNILTCKYLDATMLGVAIAGVWPRVLYREDTDASPIIVVIDHCMMKDLKDNGVKSEKVMTCMTRLCNWSPPTHDNTVLLRHLLERLQDKCKESQDNNAAVFELRKSIELLLLLQKPGFFRVIFSQTALQKIQQKFKFKHKAEDVDINMDYVTVIFQITGFYLSHSMQQQKSDQQKYLNQTIKKYFLQILKSPAAPAKVKCCIIQTMLELSVFSPVVIMNYCLHKWFKESKEEIPSGWISQLENTRTLLMTHFPQFNCPQFTK